MRNGRLWLVGQVVCALAAAAPARALHSTVGGRAVDLDTTVSVREVVEENHSTTHERTREQVRVRAAAELTTWLRFDSTTVGTNGGPTAKADRAGTYSWSDVFQDISPVAELEEAYFDVFLPSVDLRIGKQKVAWGKLDRIQPNDLINPLRYDDPFLEEEGERKIGVPAVQASYYLPAWRGVPEESRFTAVWVPKYVPFRFPLANCAAGQDRRACAERWFPPAGIPPASFHITAPPPVPIPPLDVPLSFRSDNADPPPFTLANSEIGLRYSAVLAGADAALYYFHGFDPQPAFLLTAAALGQPDATSPIGVTHLGGATFLRPEFRQIDSWGGDLAYAFDQFTMRAEGAYVRGRAFSRDIRFLLTDPTPIAQQLPGVLNALAHGAGAVPVQIPQSFAVHDCVDWGIGADYTENGYFALLQLNQTDVLHNDTALLIKNVETRALANLRKNLFADRLSVQLVAIYAFESDYTFVRPRLIYHVTDNVAAIAGYLFLAGRAHSTIGQYRRNDEGFMQLEYQL